MEILFEVLAALTAAIDAGGMTQDTLAVAVLAISVRAQAEWRVGLATGEQLQRLSRGLEHLDRYWKAYCDAHRRSEETPKRIQRSGVLALPWPMRLYFA